MCRQRVIASSFLSALFFLTTIVPSSAQTLLVTDDGNELVGEVIAAGVNTLKMKLRGSGFELVALQSIVQIQVDIDGSTPIQGQYVSWSDNEIVLRVGSQNITVRDGIIISVLDLGVAAGGPKVSPSEPALEEQFSPAEPTTTPTPGNVDAVPEVEKVPEDETAPQNATM